MATDPRINNAGSPLYLTDPQTRNRIEFTASRFADRDFTEIEEWVRSQYVRIARGSLDASSTQQEREETQRFAMAEACALSWSRPPGSQLLRSMDGWSRLCWQLIRRRHPEVTFEEIRAIVFSPERMDITQANIQAINLKFADLHPKTDAAAGQKKTPEPVPAKRKGRRRRASKSTAR